MRLPGRYFRSEDPKKRQSCTNSVARAPVPNLQELRRWLGGFRGSFARDRQAVRILNSDLLCFQCLNFLLQRTTLLTLDNDSIFYAPQVPGSQPFLFSPLSE